MQLPNEIKSKFHCNAVCFYCKYFSMQIGLLKSFKVKCILLHLYWGENALCEMHRRRIKLEDKAKVVASVWGTWFFRLDVNKFYSGPHIYFFITDLHRTFLVHFVNTFPEVWLLHGQDTDCDKKSSIDNSTPALKRPNKTLL